MLHTGFGSDTFSTLTPFQPPIELFPAEATWDSPVDWPLFKIDRNDMLRVVAKQSAAEQTGNKVLQQVVCLLGSNDDRRVRLADPNLFEILSGMAARENPRVGASQAVC